MAAVSSIMPSLLSQCEGRSLVCPRLCGPAPAGEPVTLPTFTWLCPLPGTQPEAERPGGWTGRRLGPLEHREGGDAPGTRSSPWGRTVCSSNCPLSRPSCWLLENLQPFTKFLCPEVRERRSLSRVRLFATPWTVACQVPLTMEFSKPEH